MKLEIKKSRVKMVGLGMLSCNLGHDTNGFVSLFFNSLRRRVHEFLKM